MLKLQKMGMRLFLVIFEKNIFYLFWAFFMGSLLGIYMQLGQITHSSILDILFHCSFARVDLKSSFSEKAARIEKRSFLYHKCFLLVFTLKSCRFWSFLHVVKYSKFELPNSMQNWNHFTSLALTYTYIPYASVTH